MGNPRKVSESYDFFSSWSGNVSNTAATQIAFTPVNYKQTGHVPPNAPAGAVPVMPAHEILISNPSTAPINVAITDINSAGSNGGVKTYDEMDGQQIASMKPKYLDPTTLTAIGASNFIVVPAGAVAFPIKVRAYGITIEAVGAAANNVSVQAYGPLTLLT